MPPKKPCHFHQSPQGCRNGAQCRYSHDEPRASSPATRTPPGQSPEWRRPSPSSRPNRSAPKGVCNFFWNEGKCNRGFSCRFQHRLNPNSQQPAPPDTGPHDTVEQDLAPFLTEAGLAKLSGGGTDAFFALKQSSRLKPNEAHNHLRRYLQDSYRFATTLDIYAFLNVISSASSMNAEWTQTDGQLLLASLVEGSGLRRIDDILNWPSVSISAGRDRRTLSFQRGILPLLSYISSDFVAKSTLRTHVNALLALIMEDFAAFAMRIEEALDAIFEARTFKDKSLFMSQDTLSGGPILASLSAVLYECLTRFKGAVVTHPRTAQMARRLQVWVDAWQTGVSSSPATFDDPIVSASPVVRSRVIDHLKRDIQRLVAMVDREEGKIPAPAKQSLVKGSGPTEGLIAALQSVYEGPGVERPGGPRHDNDFVRITDIRVAPTHDELTSNLRPFLPANLYGAPHPHPPESMTRLLDIQFRLLREELTAPLRSAVKFVMADMQALPRQRTRLTELVEKHGGKYRGHAPGQESVLFNVYPNVKFVSMEPDRRGISVSVCFDAPPGRARSPAASIRASFWDGMSGKRLMQGGLVGLLWKCSRDVSVHLGTIASSLNDIKARAKQHAELISVRIAFFDPDVELRILEALKHQKDHRQDILILVEAPVMFEAIRPFLDALQVEPESVPFGGAVALVGCQGVVARGQRGFGDRA